jgi:hypothetical protein
MSASEAIPALRNIADRIAGNGQGSRNSVRQPLVVIGNEAIEVPDNALEQIENGRMEVVVRTREIIIRKGTAAEVSGEQQ